VIGWAVAIPTEASDGLLSLGRPPWKGLLGIAVLAFAVRAVFLLLEPAADPAGDEPSWTMLGVQCLAEAGRPLYPFKKVHLFYPPAYPYFIAVPHLLFGTLTAVKWAQAVVGSLLVLAVGAVAARVGGPRVGFLAGSMAAIYPELIWFSVHFWSETLFMAFLWWGIERALAADARGAAGPAGAAGALWGLGILTRETTLYFSPVLALWLGIRSARPGGAKRAALFLATAAMVVVPWTARNWVVFRDFVPVSTFGALNLWQGNARLSRDEVYARVDAAGGPMEQYHFAGRMGVQAIIERQPSWLFEKLREEMPRFWEADSEALVNIARGAYGAVSKRAEAFWRGVVVAPYIVVALGFAAGLALLPLDRKMALLVGFLGYYNLLHVVTYGWSRFRLPAMPVVLTLSAAVWVAWRGGALSQVSRRRRIAAAAAATLMLALLLPSLLQTSSDTTLW
jgi:hypothetical protein